ncbi:MAG: HAD family hydrolase [Pyrobaculum sp.]
MRRGVEIPRKITFITSFWGLLAKPVDIWSVLEELAGDQVVNQVRWVIEGVQSWGYEIPLHVLAGIIAHKAGLDPRALMREATARVSSRLEPMDCSLEFLKKARERGRVAILSNTPCKCFIQLFLSTYGVEVDGLFTSDVLLRRKPLRPVFKYVLRKLGAQPHEAIYIGDEEADLGAMGVGLFTILVGRGGGHLSFQNLCELTAWIEELKDK